MFPKWKICGFFRKCGLPHLNMLDFEPYRASLNVVEALQGYLTDWQQNECVIIKAAKQNTVAAVMERLMHCDNLHELFASEQDELYITLHQDCKLYVGNSGAETRCLGDLRGLDLKATAEIIKTLPGNRDYGAYYDVDALPATDDLIEALQRLPENAVYGDFESVVYRGLAELGIPTKIMK